MNPKTTIDRVYQAIGEARGFAVGVDDRHIQLHGDGHGYLEWRIEFGGAVRNGASALASATSALQTYVAAIRAAGVDATGIDRPQHDSSGWYILIWVGSPATAELQHDA